MKRHVEAAEKIIISIDDKEQHVAIVARKTGVGYTHVSNVSRLLEDEGILKRVPKDGKSIFLILTEKGKRVKEAYTKLNEAFSS